MYVSMYVCLYTSKLTFHLHVRDFQCMYCIALHCIGKEGLSAIVFAGKKLNQPIAWHGPFVMTTNEVSLL